MDIDYGALFGLEQPDDTTGVNDAEAAEPQESGDAAGSAQGANEPEAADPAAEDSGEQVQETENQEDKSPGQEQKQTPEQNAQFAAARRKAEAERDRAVAQAKREAKEEAQRTIDQFFAASGLMNPYTKQPITTKAEYDAYRTQYDAEQKAAMMQKTGMSAEDMQRFISGLPEVRQAMEAKAAADAAARQARRETAKARVEEQLREIQTMDPSIKTLGDLSKMDTYPKLYDMVQRGYSISDAYKLANYDQITARASAASRQAAINAQGKQHLSATKPRGTEAASVPSGTMELYKFLNPGATEAEIQRHYNRVHRKE